MTSVVIAAHNEAAVIGRSLDALLAGAEPNEIDVLVVANGCTDATAQVARSRAGVRVIEVARPGKANALNVGDPVAGGYPRIYLDADVKVDISTVRGLVSSLGDGTLAAVPGRRMDLSRSSLLVRAYFAINSRLPAFASGIFGRGMIALAEEGRGRFDAFPDMIADDLFLDSLFQREEKREVASVIATITAPRTARYLVRRLVRVRRGNAAMRQAGRQGLVTQDVRGADRWSWLRDVVRPTPSLVPAAIIYLAITAVAAVRARRVPVPEAEWGRDESSRT